MYCQGLGDCFLLSFPAPDRDEPVRVMIDCGVLQHTPGEAIKFLPGVMLTYSAGEAREVSINGVPTANVPVTVGGFDLASNAGGGTGRQTNFEQVSINSMSRPDRAFDAASQYR